MLLEQRCLRFAQSTPRFYLEATKTIFFYGCKIGPGNEVAPQSDLLLDQSKLSLEVSQAWTYFRGFSKRVCVTIALTAAWAVTCVHPTIFAPLRGLSPVFSHVFFLSSIRPGISVYMRMREEGVSE